MVGAQRVRVRESGGCRRFLQGVVKVYAEYHSFQDDILPHRISLQDTLKTKDKCVATATKAVKEGKSVVIGNYKLFFLASSLPFHLTFYLSLLQTTQTLTSPLAPPISTLPSRTIYPREVFGLWHRRRWQGITMYIVH